jgi:hypothetical protein
VSPSKVLDRSRLHLATAASPRRWQPHMELAALQSVVCIFVSALLGYAAPTDVSPFRADHDGLPSIPSPAIGLRSRVHPLVSLALLLSSSCLRRPVHLSRARARPLTTSAFLGVLRPLRDINSASPRPAGIPSPPSFRPQRFTRSRRLAPRSALQACFILLPRPGFALQGFPPSYQPYHLVGGRSLLAVGGSHLSPVAR